MNNGRNLSNEKSCETSSPIKPPVEVCVDRSFKGPLVLSSATRRWLEVNQKKSLNGGKKNWGGIVKIRPSPGPERELQKT